MKRPSDQGNGGESGANTSRVNIIRATRALMAEQGFSATTMQQIVGRAGTSIGNAYFYFDNKQHLLDEIVSEVAEEQWSAIDRYLENIEIKEERLGAGLYLNSYPLLAGVVPELRLSSGPPDHLVMDAFQDRVRRHYFKVLPEYFPDHSSDELAFIIDAWIGAGRNLILARAAGEVSGPISALVRALVIFDVRAVGFTEPQVQLAVKGMDGVEDTGPEHIFKSHSGG